jgi:hypothetical protein
MVAAELGLRCGANVELPDIGERLAQFAPRCGRLRRALPPGNRASRLPKELAPLVRDLFAREADASQQALVELPQFVARAAAVCPLY